MKQLIHMKFYLNTKEEENEFWNNKTLESPKITDNQNEHDYYYKNKKKSNYLLLSPENIKIDNLEIIDISHDNNDRNIITDIDIDTGNIHIVPNPIIYTDKNNEYKFQMSNYGNFIQKVRKNIIESESIKKKIPTITIYKNAGDVYVKDPWKNKKWIYATSDNGNNKYCINFESIAFNENTNKLCAWLGRVQFYKWTHESEKGPHIVGKDSIIFNLPVVTNEKNITDIENKILTFENAATKITNIFIFDNDGSIINKVKDDNSIEITLEEKIANEFIEFIKQTDFNNK